jgi:hypothetical protein
VPDFTVHWHQRDASQVTSWEFQHSRNGIDEWQWVAHVEPVDGCLDCFEAIVSIPSDALFVRSRAVGPSGASEWTDPNPVPELGFLTALLIGVLWLALMVWITRRIG